jgi:hypothetical protein
VRLFSIFIIALFLASCGSIKPITPAMLTEQKKETKELHYNKIVIPIEIDLNPYFETADKNIPETTVGSDFPCSGVRYNYEFTKDNFKIITKNNELFSELNGSYWIKMNYCSGCTKLYDGKEHCLTPLVPFSCGIGETKPSVKIQLATQINVNKSYGVESKTRIEQIKPINPCQVTLFKFNATEEVMKRVKNVVEQSAKDIDKQLNSISFKKEAADAWKSMSKSVSVPYLGYIHIKPTEISLVKPLFSNNKLVTAIQLNCATYLDQSAEDIALPNIPELKIISSIPKDTFEVVTDIQLSYDSLSKFLTAQIKGQSFDIKGNTFTFNSVTVRANTENKLVIGVEFGGSKKGILYMLANPVFENKEKIFSLENMEYELETKSLLLKMADWLYSKKIKEELTKASRMDFKDKFNALRTSVNSSLKRNIGDFKLSGQMIDAQVFSIFVNKEYLNLQTKVDAKLKVSSK